MISLKPYLTCMRAYGLLEGQRRDMLEYVWRRNKQKRMMRARSEFKRVIPKQMRNYQEIDCYCCGSSYIERSG